MMKSLVKVKYLPLFALLLGSSLALATDPVQTQNVRNVGTASAPVWQDLQTSAYSCDQEANNLCTAHKDASGNISDEQEGQFIAD
jgi:hypothetical protein